MSAGQVPSAGSGWRAWALGLAVTLVLAFGGVIYSSLDTRIATAEGLAQRHEVEIAVVKSTLERMEKTLGKIEENTRKR